MKTWPGPPVVSGTFWRMPLEVLQRFVFDKGPQELGDRFRLTKRGRDARAALFTHAFGCEDRLLT